MKIKKLFDELEAKYKKENGQSIFDESGMIMIKENQKLNFGFFPAGSGIFVPNKSKIQEAEIEEGGAMILGNDFGTLTYLDKINNGDKIEGGSSTIRNLKKLGLENKSFHTNFYLGIRDDKTHEGTTMTDRIAPLEQNYKSFCFRFFLKQLEIINPKVVVCLGHDVRLALAENVQQFAIWKSKSISFKKLYSTDNFVINVDDELGKRKFIVIPHPCFASNLKKNYVDKILKELTLN